MKLLELNGNLSIVGFTIEAVCYYKYTYLVTEDDPERYDVEIRYASGRSAFESFPTEEEAKRRYEEIVDFLHNL